jgi:Na+-transporting NADH:ubiquinone oxidoreductase subunit C
MNLNSNGYVLAFATGMCVTVSAVLAFFATALKPAQKAAEEFDRQKNVMIAAGLCTADDTRTRPELEKLYQERVSEFVVDTKDGSVLADKSPKDVEELNKAAAKADKADGARYRVVATTKKDGNVASYVLPISGKGLWSTLYGYLALEADKSTVRGITFYKHGETPGLGGEVENPQWTAQWQGKTVRDASGKLVSITVKKGKVDEDVPTEKRHFVDGLSGATITSNGVTKFVKQDLQAFDPYLSKN